MPSARPAIPRSARAALLLCAAAILLGEERVLAIPDAALPQAEQLQLADFPRPQAMIAAVRFRTESASVVCVSFSEDLERGAGPTAQAFAQLALTAPGLRSALLLIGHGDGRRIGMGPGDERRTPDPADAIAGVDLIAHLKANRARYHEALGVQINDRIECVALLVCTRRAIDAGTVLRDGLGYVPQRRVLPLPDGRPTPMSGLAAAALALAEPAGGRLRAAIYDGPSALQASLAEVGERPPTAHYELIRDGRGLVLRPTPRR